MTEDPESIRVSDSELNVVASLPIIVIDIETSTRRTTRDTTTFIDIINPFFCIQTPHSFTWYFNTT